MPSLHRGGWPRSSAPARAGTASPVRFSTARPTVVPARSSTSSSSSTSILTVPPDTLWHGATCNLLVPRSLWDELGPFPEDLDGGEDTQLTMAARSRGRFRFAPDAVVTHQNRTRWSEVIAHQVTFGRFTARLGRRGAYRWLPLVRYTPLAPMAVLGRLASIYTRVGAMGSRLSLARGGFRTGRAGSARRLGLGARVRRRQTRRASRHGLAPRSRHRSRTRRRLRSTRVVSRLQPAST